jgi:hypothetical protein
MVANMEIGVSDTYIKISNVFIFDDYVIKEYYHRYDFVDYIVKNETDINMRLLNLGISFIPKLLSVEKNMQKTKLAFKKIDGRTLASLKFSYMEFEEKFKIFMKILNMVKVLHINNLIHNDLSLANLMLNHDKEVYMIDFALSTSFNKKDSINDLNSLTYIGYKIFNVKFDIKADDIHNYIRKIGEIKYELLYKRGFKVKDL